MPTHESLPEMLQRLRSGDQAAAEELHRRYAQRLCALAERQIGSRLGRRVGEDDIVQSVFRTFFRRTAEGEFSIDHSGSLWHLLVRITLNKIRRQGERHHAGKRDVAAEVYAGDGKLHPEVVAHDPAPEEVVLLIDELEDLLTGLKEPEPEIVRLGIQGYSSEEIATEVKCSRWTVRRVLNRTGHQLRKRLKDDFDH